MAHNSTPNTAPRATTPAPPFYVEFDQNFGPIRFDYQSITASSQHEDTSFEELRLKHYAEQGVCAANQAPLPPSGLVTATISNAWQQFQAPLFSKLSTAPGNNPFSSRIITFRVGKEKTRDFTIHENLIAAHSEFVRTALTKEWKEVKEGIVSLPEDDIESFDLYQQWIYTGQIFLSRMPTPVDENKRYEVLVNAYLLGEKLIDSDFKDTMLDCIIHVLRATRMFDARLTNLVYENTPPESPLRRLWLDIYIFSGSPNWLDEKAIGEFVHSEFAVELSRAQMRFSQGIRPEQAPFLGSSCVYHEHVDGGCYKGKSSFG